MYNNYYTGDETYDAYWLYKPSPYVGNMHHIQICNIAYKDALVLLGWNQYHIVSIFRRFSGCVVVILERTREDRAQALLLIINRKFINNIVV